MTTTYLLPCQCGERFQVDPSESGLVMKCRCGATLEVPTLRGLARLEQVIVEEPSPSARAWGGAQRGMAIGALIALIGIGMSIYWTVRPLPGPHDVFSADILMKVLGIFPNEDQLRSSPADTLILWRIVADQDLMTAPAKIVEEYHRAREIVVWWRVVSYAVGGIGLVILGVSFVVLQIGRSRRQGQPAPIGG